MSDESLFCTILCLRRKTLYKEVHITSAGMMATLHIQMRNRLRNKSDIIIAAWQKHVNARKKQSSSYELKYIKCQVKIIIRNKQLETIGQKEKNEDVSRKRSTKHRQQTENLLACNTRRHAAPANNVTVREGGDVQVICGARVARDVTRVILVRRQLHRRTKEGVTRRRKTAVDVMEEAEARFVTTSI